MTKQSGLMTSALNAASSGIKAGIGLVGSVASSVTTAGAGVASSAIGGVGKLVERMTSPQGDRQPPIVNYTDMVVKDNGTMVA